MWLVISLTFSLDLVGGFYLSQRFGTKCYIVYKQAPKPPARQYDVETL